jgi:hypothetical protein
MLVFATLLATLSSIVRSRAALELENLALRHQIARRVGRHSLADGNASRQLVKNPN